MATVKLVLSLADTAVVLSPRCLTPLAQKCLSNSFQIRILLSCLDSQQHTTPTLLVTILIFQSLFFLGLSDSESVGSFPAMRTGQEEKGPANCDVLEKS